MTNPRQLVHTTFGGGIDERTRPELVDPTDAFVAIENVRVSQMGGFDKRYGFAAQTLSRADGGSRSAAYKLFAHGQMGCAIDGTTLDVYSPTGAKNWRIGRVPNFGVKRIPVSGAWYNASTSDGEVLDCVYCNGYYFVATIDHVALSGSVDYRMVVTVVERATGVPIKTFVNSTSHTSDDCFMQLCTVGTTVVIVMRADAGATLSAFKIDASSATGIYAGLVSIGNIATNVGGDIADFAVVGLTTVYAVAYSNNSGGGNSLTVKTFNTSSTTAVNSSTTVSTTGAIHGVAIDGREADTIWVAWSRSTGNALHVVGFNSSLAITVADATILTVLGTPDRVGVVYTSSTTGVVTARYEGWSTEDLLWPMTATAAFANVAGTASLSGAVGYLGGWSAWTTPTYLGGRVFGVYGWNAEKDIAEVFNIGVFDITPPSGVRSGARPVAAPTVGLSRTPARPKLSANNHHLTTVSSTVVAFAHWVKDEGTTTAIEIVELDAGDPARWQTAEHNGDTYLSAGLIYGFDGHQLFESGWMAPPTIRLTSSGTGISGTFDYFAIYEWTDAEGNVHWSEPSKIQGVTVANKTVTITAIPNTATWRDAHEDDATIAEPSNARRVRIQIYRTVASGSVYYYVGTILNDPTRNTCTLDDATADADLIANAEPYTNPGTLGTALVRKCAPAARALTKYQDMLVALADDGQSLWTTGQKVIGEGAWWNPDFQYPVAPNGVAIAAMDGTLYFWTRREVYAISGDAPVDNGSSGGLGPPRRLAADVGCIEPRSIVITAKGIFFRSDRGIEILTRAGSVEWIGEPVQNTVNSYPVCTAATVDAGEALVYFELAATETANQVSGGGRTLVYDLSRDKWGSVDRRKNQAGTSDAPAQSAAYIYTGSAWRYAWLGTDGRVYVEDQTTHLDPGSTWVTKRAVTGAFKLSGVQGYQMLEATRLLMKYATAHDLALYWAVDYGSSYAAPRTWTAAQIATITGELPNQQMEHTLDDNVEGQAIAFKIEDATPSSGSVGTGEGATWLALSVMGTTRDGLYPLPDVCR